jgi:hypothetical protein
MLQYCKCKMDLYAHLFNTWTFKEEWGLNLQDMTNYTGLGKHMSFFLSI